ncbi:MAG TPA: ABC transporter ATP-binding protein [Bacteroidia bacterium]|nr:ABC transporter ATP-binding protein [Bacteroidia bacterium]MBP7714672.1 ABC transporter ATP-binding protein [Bacteroidia bacterium]MBP8667596.1 ABC transporter ATP-binding protein [Bacteroidia bacterium]HOZ82328.1 ABC transporter ATP-binding protein [Bacteroidia bacterium]HOZ90630.1 ABC transporter ATP-binding protein [Bacteroidia bacterium]
MLEVKNLKVVFHQNSNPVVAVNDFSFSIAAGETLGLVGESGSGKTVSSLALLGLLNNKNVAISGNASFSLQQPVDLLTLNEKQLTAIRGRHIAMIMQEPMQAFNPLFTCGHQVTEAIRKHTALNKNDATEKVLQQFEKVKLPNPLQISKRFPHQLSGGQLQRVAIAMAISCNPSLLIADEPTTALDATVQKDILLLLQQLQSENNMSMLFISHDLEAVKLIAHNTLVVHAGQMVEQEKTEKIFAHPAQEYTKELLQSRPSGFKRNSVISEKNILSVENISKSYNQRQGLLRSKQNIIKAVDNISFTVKQDETLGIAGESGSGKTTLAKLLLRLIETDSGVIKLSEENLKDYPIRTKQLWRKKIQAVFQNPHGSLDPEMTVGRQLTEVFKLHFSSQNTTTVKNQIIEWFEKVGLTEQHFNRYPHELSSGQKQRLCIARALIPQPDLLICDEAVSALDVSVQAKILELINRLQQQFHFGCIFISHDLKVIRQMCDNVLVMKDGKADCYSATEKLFEKPPTTYSEILLKSII